MSTSSMASDWYYAKQGGSVAGTPAQQTGPHTWEQLYSLAQAGEFGPHDLVWNPELPDWLPAGRVPGLFTEAQTAAVAPAAYPAAAAPQPAAYPPAAYPPAAYPPVAYQAAAYQAPAASSGRRRSWLLPVLIPLIALVIVGGGLGAYFGFTHGGDETDGGSTGSSQATSTTEKASIMGVAESTAPDRAKLVKTSTWGEVPVNAICVVLAEGKSRDDAVSLAQSLGGSVAGEIEFINAYQIVTAGSTEADLASALQQAAATPGVTSAFPNMEMETAAEIWGVRQSPLNDPAYGDGRGKGLELIGAPKAWSYVRGSGLPLNDVQVGVVDEGLWRGTGEFDGDPSIYFPDKGAGEISDPRKVKNAAGVLVDNPNGSHSVMVCGVLGGDPKNGGPTGVASPVLEDHLTMSVIDIFGGDYGVSEVSNPDPNDPTVTQWSDGKSYSWGNLVAIARQIESGAKIINCSWNNKKDFQDAQTAAVYKQFFEKMSEQHPEVLFVCSAGNYQRVEDGAVSWPAGLNLSNMITVGNVMNDGTNNPKATQTSMQNTTQGHEFEITLAAPGHQAVQGVDKDGRPIVAGYTNGEYTNYGGGTSAAAPQVSAAAAILLALDPELTAAEIKDILSRTARPGPPELGGKILAVDLAVLEVINQERERLGLPTVTAEQLEKGGTIDAVAISQEEADTWMVKAIVEVLPSVDGAEITITSTTGTKIDGETSRKITAPGEVVWIPVTVPNEMAEITVTRLDSGAASIITFQPIDLNGTWVGTYTITDMTVDEAAAAAAQAAAGASSSSDDPTEGCAAGAGMAAVFAILEQIKGKPMGLTMEITADMDAGTGEAVAIIDASTLDLGEGVQMGEAEPTTIPFTFVGQVLTFQLEQNEGSTTTMTGTVSREGEILIIDGVIANSGTGFLMKAVFRVTLQE